MKKITAQDVEERISNTFSVPKDITMGLCNLYLVGNREIIIENYLGIQTYSSEVIVVKTKKLAIELTGENLVINYYTNKDMKISGKIAGIKFL